MLKRTFYTLIIAILLAVASVYVYLYTVVYVGGMGSDLGLMNKKSNDLTKEEESLNSVKRVAQNADQRNAEISKYIVPVKNEGSISFVKTLEDLADSFGLKSNTTSIEIVSDENLSKINKEYLSVKQSIVGPSILISSFVKKLEYLPFNTKIRSYSLTRIGGESGFSSALSGTSTKSTPIINQQLDLEILVIKEK